jgi:hypothetical protein
MHQLLTLSLVFLLAAAFPAWADDDHDHEQEHSHAAQHGGILADSGHHHLEIVAKDGTLAVYVGGVHGTQEMVSKAKANATILSEGKKVDVDLAPGEGALLKGSGPFKAGPGTIIVLTLTMPEHDPEQVRVKLK